MESKYSKPFIKCAFWFDNILHDIKFHVLIDMYNRMLVNAITIYIGSLNGWKIHFTDNGI